MDIRLALMSGVDIPIPECQIILHQPRIKEIGMIGEEAFFVGIQCLCINKSMVNVEDKSVLDEINNFQVFMTVMNDKAMKDKRQKVSQVLSLLGLGKATFTPQSLILTDSNKTDHIIDANNFEVFQKILKDVACANTGPMDQQAFNPKNDKAREIAEKLMRGRQRVAQQKGSSTSSTFSRYLSMLTIGVHIPLTELVNCTMFQLYDLAERYILYINWDLDIRTRLAGGKPDSHPDDWMKNIH